MENLNENVGGKIEIEFQDWLDTMNDKDYPERLTLETVIEYSQDTLRDYNLDDWIPQGQSTSESKKMEDFDLRKYLAENKLLNKETSSSVYVVIPFYPDGGRINENDVMVFKNSNDAYDYVNSLEGSPIVIETELK